MKTNIVLNKSLDFAIKTVEIYKYLIYKKKRIYYVKATIKSKK